MKFFNVLLPSALLALALSFCPVVGDAAHKSVKPTSASSVSAASQPAPSVMTLTLGTIGTETAPIIVKAAPDPRDELVQETKDRYDRWTLGFTAVLAVFTAVLATSTIYLSRETRSLRLFAAQQAEDMKTSIELARRSSDAAVALELPLFVIENSEIYQQGGKFVVRLGNHGRTPANILRHCLSTVFGDELSSVPTYGPNDVESVAVARVVNPKDDIGVIRPASHSREDMEAVYAGKTKLWVHGFLEYLDFLKQKRRVGFCVLYVPIPDATYPSLISNQGMWIQSGPASYTYDKLVNKDDR